jgi:lipid-A-disaccharide synthase
LTVIFFIAGEASGDVLGARLMAAIQAQRPDIKCAGIGGPRMTEGGLDSLFPMQDIAVMGLAEILPRILSLRRRIAQTITAIKTQKPDIVVTIDSPGFSLRVLRAISGLNIKRIHYVAPQVWAWRQERVKHFPGLWDELLCLLPFEPDFFEQYGLNPVFTGHPVLESGADQGNAARFWATHDIPSDAVPVILMPGSRVTETKQLLPIFGETMALLQEKIPGLLPVLAAAPVISDAVATLTAAWKIKPLIIRGVDERYDAFAAARAALTKSGTSTLELSLAGVPMAVTYRVNPVSAFIARRAIKVKYVAMINLLAGRELVPELLQENCTPAKLAAVLHGLLTNAAQAAAQRDGFATALATLAAPEATPSTAAAARILAQLGS